MNAWPLCWLRRRRRRSTTIAAITDNSTTSPPTPPPTAAGHHAPLPPPPLRPVITPEAGGGGGIAAIGIAATGRAREGAGTGAASSGGVMACAGAGATLGGDSAVAVAAASEERTSCKRAALCVRAAAVQQCLCMCCALSIALLQCIVGSGGLTLAKVTSSAHAAHALGVSPDCKRARTPRTRCLQINRSVVLVFAPAAAAQTLHWLRLGRWSQLCAQLAWYSPHHASLRALAPKSTPPDRRRTACPRMWQQTPRARWTASDQTSCCVRARRCLAPPTAPLIACLQWSHCQATRPSCAQALPSRSGLGT